MDSDEDELGVIDTTSTPYRVEKYVEANAKTKKGRVAVAGPSSKPPSKTRVASRKRSPAPQSTVDDSGDDSGNGRDGDELVAPQRRSRSKRATSREIEQAGASRAGSVPRGKGKGKAKLNDAREPSPEVMDVDNLEEIRADEEAEPPEVVERSWVPKKKPQDNTSAAWKKREERHRRELERSQKHCQDALSQRDNLARQLEELFHVRNTEVETRAEHQAAVYESRIQAQEEMIQELTTQLARVDSLTREGKTSTLHFLTREAADEERRGVERQVEKLKQVLKEKDKMVADKDTTIHEQGEEIRQLRLELDAEIERSKTLASSRQNGRDVQFKPRVASTPKSGVKLEGLKATHAHRLYEDLTNILILDCYSEPSPENDESQWVYNCLYAPSDSFWNIAFTLRAYHELEESGEIVEKVAYTPKEMSDKSPEWLARLDFLAEEFTFNRRQLDVFLDKLYTAMSAPEE